MNLFDDQTQTVPIPAGLRPGRQTAQWVLDQITTFPDTYNQGTWALNSPACGTQCCAAGWAAMAHGADFVEQYRIFRFDVGLAEQYHWRLAGQRALDLEPHEAMRLFSGGNNPQFVIEVLKVLAAGEKPDWDGLSGEHNLTVPE